MLFYWFPLASGADFSISLLPFVTYCQRILPDFAGYGFQSAILYLYASRRLELADTRLCYYTACASIRSPPSSPSALRQEMAISLILIVVYSFTSHGL